MLSRFRPSPALVVATIALFVSLGGFGYAATKIGTKDIKNGAVTAKKLHKNAVRTARIKNGAVTARKIRDGAVGTGKLADAAVGTAELADSAVTSVKLADGSIATGTLADGAVTGDKLAKSAVGTEKIARDASGVAQVAVNVEGTTGTVRSYFSRLGGTPVVKKTAPGTYVIAIPGVSTANAAKLIHVATPSRNVAADRIATVSATSGNPVVRTATVVKGELTPADSNFVYVLYRQLP